MHRGACRAAAELTPLQQAVALLTPPAYRWGHRAYTHVIEWALADELADQPAAEARP